MTRRRRAVLLSVPYAVCLAVLLGAEAVVRLTLPPLASLALYVTAPEQHSGFRDRRQVAIFEGDPLLLWRLKPDLDRVVWDFTLVSTNRQGLRQRGPLGPRRGVRVLCLGDSVTFGFRVPLVWAERPREYDARELPFPMLLEDRLREANPGRDVEVVNLAVPGYSSHQGLAALTRDVGTLGADLVVASFGWNDANLRARSDREAMPVDRWHVLARAVVARSQALSHLALSLRGAGLAGPVTERVPPDQFVDNFRRMTALAREHGARLVAVAPVYRDPDTFPAEAGRIATLRAALREAMRHDGIPYLEVRELTETAWPGNARVFGETIHPNAEGHRLLAKELLALIARERLLPLRVAW